MNNSKVQISSYDALTLQCDSNAYQQTAIYSVYITYFTYRLSEKLTNIQFIKLH